MIKKTNKNDNNIFNIVNIVIFKYTLISHIQTILEGKYNYI